MSPSSSSGKILSGLKSITKIADAREGGAQEPSYFSTITDTTKTIRDSVFKLLGVTAATPFTVARAAVAIPNNLVGLLTTGVDRALVRPLEWTRGQIWKLFSSPKKYILGGT